MKKAPPPQRDGAAVGLSDANRIGLRNVENCRGPGTTAGAALGGLFLAVRRFRGGDAVGGNERHHLDAMLTAACLPAQSLPGVICEEVFARPDVVFRNALRGESGKDC